MKEFAQDFATRVVNEMKNNTGFLGLALTGSYAYGQDDEFSDLDLILVCTDKHYENALKSMQEFASKLGTLGAAYETKEDDKLDLLSCLYVEPTLHVDLKFVNLKQFSAFRAKTHVLWEWNGALSAAVNRKREKPKDMTLQFAEERFWIWFQEASAKLGRGEFFYAYDMCAHIRNNALVPLVLMRVKSEGARHLEKKAGEYMERLAKCVPSYDKESIANALAKMCELYFAIRYELADDSFVRREEAEIAACEYFSMVKRRIDNGEL